MTCSMSGRNLSWAGAGGTGPEATRQPSATRTGETACFMKHQLRRLRRDHGRSVIADGRLSVKARPVRLEWRLELQPALAYCCGRIPAVINLVGRLQGTCHV